MSIRVKLYMSYLAMAFVPIIFIIAAMLLVFYASGKQDVREFSDAKEAEQFEQALVYGELSYVISDDAGKLESEAFIDDLQKRLGDLWAGLLIARNGKVTEVPPFLEQLSPDENWQALLDNPPKVLAFNYYRFGTHQVEFQYPDGSIGKAVLLRRTEAVPIFWHPLSLAIVLAIVCLTSLLLSYFVSRSIIRPIQSLRTAALRIKDGDLDYKLELKCGKDMGTSSEIRQLSQAFEEMRIRLKHSIEQSLQYEENRKQLLSHISHDLKTPISAIKGYVEGIIDGIANTDEKRSRYMQTIYRNATDMDQLIDELFLFSKLDLQKVAYDFKIVDLPRYVEHFMDEQRFDLEKSSIQLIIERYEGEAITVAADPDKLNRVFANILNNSVKYMGQHDEQQEKIITIRIIRQTQFAVIEIEDSGPGIDSNDLSHIFERFYRAEQSRNSETGGSGLGLAIVKQIIEGHGGTVWAENTSSGARFNLKLPITTTVKAVKGHEKHSYH